MKKKVSDVKIFIGHSTKEFADEIGGIVSFLNGTLSDLFETNVEAFVCEQKAASSQDEINHYIATKADLSLFCFLKNVGQYTYEEYQVALKAYKDSEFEHPKIAVYFKNGEEGTKDKKKNIEDDRIYYTEFDTVDTIKFDALLMLKGISKETFNFEFNNDGLYINQKKVKNIYLEQLPLYKNNKDINEIEKQLVELKALAEEYLENSQIDEFKDVSKKINSLLTEKSIKRKAVLEFCEKSVNSMLENNESDLMRLARKCATKGMIDEALQMLPSVSEIKAESDFLLSDLENKRKELKEKAELLLDIINFNTLKNINETRKQINESGAQLMKILPELKDFELVKKFLTYCSDQVITINISDFLIDLLDEKFIKNDNRNIMYILHALRSYLQTYNDKEELIELTHETYCKILQENDAEKNFYAETKGFDLLFEMFFSPDHPKVLINLFKLRKEYLLNNAKGDFAKLIYREYLVTQSYFSRFVSFCTKIEEATSLLTEIADDVFEFVENNPTISARLLTNFSASVVMVKDYEIYEKTANTLKAFVDIFKDSADPKKQTIALDLYNNLAIIYMELGKVSEFTKLFEETSKLLSKVMDANDTKFLPMFINFTYFNISGNLATIDIESLADNFESLLELEEQLDVESLKRNVSNFLKQKVMLANKLLQSACFNQSALICGSGLNLAKKAGLTTSTCGYFCFIFYSLLISIYMTISDETKLNFYVTKLAKHLSHKDDFIDNSEIERLVKQGLESIVVCLKPESDNYKMLKNALDDFSDEEKVNKNTQLDYLAESNNQFKILYNHLMNFDEKNKKEILEAYAKFLDCVIALGNTNITAYQTLFPQLSKLLSELYMRFDPKDLQPFYPKYATLTETFKKINENLVTQQEYSIAASILAGACLYPKKDSKFILEQENKIRNIVDNCFKKDFENKEQTLMSFLSTIFLIGLNVPNSELKEFALSFVDKINQIDFSDDINGRLMKTSLVGQYYGLKNNISFAEIMALLNTLDGSEELTEEKFLELLKEADDEEEDSESDCQNEVSLFYETLDAFWKKIKEEDYKDDINDLNERLIKLTDLLIFIAKANYSLYLKAVLKFFSYVRYVSEQGLTKELLDCIDKMFDLNKEFTSDRPGPSLTILFILYYCHYEGYMWSSEIDENHMKEILDTMLDIYNEAYGIDEESKYDYQFDLLERLFANFSDYEEEDKYAKDIAKFFYNEFKKIPENELNKEEHEKYDELDDYYQTMYIK